MAELRRCGIELRVLSLRQPKEALRHDFIDRAGLDEITCYEAKRFEAVLREFRPQLLHSHFATEPTAAARELANELELPFTFTAHGYDIRRKPPPDFAERAAAAQAVVTVSNANAGYISRTFGVPPEHIEVIPCGVDTDRFRPAARQGEEGQNRSSRADASLIVTVARHVQVKNLVLLLAACALLRDRGASFRCAMVGDGPLRNDLEKSRHRFGLEEIVEFTGALEQSEVLKWWQQATVAALTSHNEGMPVCLMEAAACGVPAVATAVGGVPELVQHGITGLLTRPGDAEALASALGTLLEDPPLAARLGKTAREWAEKQFSVRRQVESLRRLWARVLAGDMRR